MNKEKMLDIIDYLNKVGGRAFLLSLSGERLKFVYNYGVYFLILTDDILYLEAEMIPEEMDCFSEKWFQDEKKSSLEEVAALISLELDDTPICYYDCRVLTADKQHDTISTPTIEWCVDKKLKNKNVDLLVNLARTTGCEIEIRDLTVYHQTDASRIVEYGLDTLEPKYFGNIFYSDLEHRNFSEEELALLLRTVDIVEDNYFDFNPYSSKIKEMIASLPRAGILDAIRYVAKQKAEKYFNRSLEKDKQFNDWYYTWRASLTIQSVTEYIDSVGVNEDAPKVLFKSKLNDDCF